MGQTKARPEQVDLSDIDEMLSRKASAALDNLSSTAVNVDILPSANDARSLGSVAKRWLSGWFNQLVFREIAAPSAPSSGHVAVYFKTDGKMYYKDDAGTETEVGSGGGVVLSAMRVYTSSSTWTKPSGLHHVIVEVVGGGGGGGGVTSVSGMSASAGGGGGAGYSLKKIDAADLGSTETVTVGNGGSGAAAGGNSGSTGGTSSFGSHCSATGGYGGALRVANATVPLRGASCGENGIGAGGDVNGSGVPGVVGYLLRNSANSIAGGGGGSSMFGSGATQKTNNGNGDNAKGYGGGGGGAVSADVATDYAGGNGTSGIVIVREYSEG